MFTLRRLPKGLVRILYTLVLVIVLSSAAACTVDNTNSSATPKPNIIFILIDDQRHDFLSFRDHPWLETPHIDRLAENSVYFDHAYVTTSLCSPSRASIVTGQFAHTHQVAGQ